MNNDIVKRKKAADCFLLLIAPAMLLMSILGGMVANDEDLLKLYAWNSLLVELIVLFIPATAIILLCGGLSRFGFKKIGAIEFLLCLALGIGIFFITTCINAVTTAILYLFGIQGAGSQIPSTSGPAVLLVILFIAVIPAIAEETAFRGVFMRSWMPYGRYSAVFHSALLFAMVHFQIKALPALFFAGLAFSYISLICDSVYSSITMHFSYNASAVLLSVLLLPLTENNAQLGDAIGDIYEIMGDSGQVDIVFFVSILLASALYFSVGFLVAYASYRSLLNIVAKRRGIEPCPIKELKAKLENATDDEPDYIAGGVDIEGENPPVPVKKEKLLNFKIISSYVLLLLVGIVAIIMEHMA